MDQRTEQLWRRHAAPFDDLTLWTAQLPTATLRTAIATIVGLLDGLVDNPRLHTSEDWHEHDGYLSDAAEVPWSALLAASASEGALRDASPEDDGVRRAWRADDGSFYLRWCHFDDEPPSGGDTDFSASREIVDVVARQLAQLGIEVEIGPAAEFFEDRWGG
jgi:hypothetical protein